MRNFPRAALGRVFITRKMGTAIIRAGAYPRKIWSMKTWGKRARWASYITCTTALRLASRAAGVYRISSRKREREREVGDTEKGRAVARAKKRTVLEMSLSLSRSSRAKATCCCCCCCCRSSWCAEHTCCLRPVAVWLCTFCSIILYSHESKSICSYLARSKRCGI